MINLYIYYFLYIYIKFINIKLKEKKIYNKIELKKIKKNKN